MLATVTGLQGGAHNGLGKGFGGLLGGFTIESTKSTHKAFRLFGFTCAAISVFYIIIVIILAIRRRHVRSSKRQGKGDGQESERVEEKIETAPTGDKNVTESDRLLERLDVDAEADIAEDINAVTITRESPIGGSSDM